MNVAAQTKIRDYSPKDFEAVKAIHEQNDIDYRLPDLSSPLFLVKKVAVDEHGVVRALLGARIQSELYLQLDKSDWAGPEEKNALIHALDDEVRDASWLRGVDDCVLYLPPGMERFGERLVDDFGFTKPRDGWTAFSRGTQRENSN